MASFLDDVLKYALKGSGYAAEHIDAFIALAKNTDNGLEAALRGGRLSEWMATNGDSMTTGVRGIAQQLAGDDVLNTVLRNIDDPRFDIAGHLRGAGRTVSPELSEALARRAELSGLSGSSTEAAERAREARERLTGERRGSGEASGEAGEAGSATDDLDSPLPADVQENFNQRIRSQEQRIERLRGEGASEDVIRAAERELERIHDERAIAETLARDPELRAAREAAPANPHFEGVSDADLLRQQEDMTSAINQREDALRGLHRELSEAEAGGDAAAIERVRGRIATAQGELDTMYDEAMPVLDEAWRRTNVQMDELTERMRAAEDAKKYRQLNRLSRQADELTERLRGTARRPGLIELRENYALHSMTRTAAERAAANTDLGFWGSRWTGLKSMVFWGPRYLMNSLTPYAHYRWHTRWNIAQFDAYKQNSITRHLIELDSTAASGGNQFRGAANADGELVRLSARQGLDQMRNRAAGLAMNSGDEAAALRAIAEETGAIVTRYTETMRSVEPITELNRQLGAFNGDTLVATIRSNFVGGQTVSTENVIGLIDGELAVVRRGFEDALAAATDDRHRTLLSTQREAYESAVALASDNIRGLGEIKPDNVAELERILQGLSTDMGRRAGSIETEVIEPITESARRALQEQRTQLTGAVEEITGGLDEIAGVSTRLSETVDGLQENIRTILGTNEQSTLAGGTAVARQAARRTQDAVTTLGEFNARIGDEVGTAVERTNGALEEANRIFDDLLEGRLADADPAAVARATERLVESVDGIDDVSRRVAGHFGSEYDEVSRALDRAVRTARGATETTRWAGPIQIPFTNTPLFHRLSWMRDVGVVDRSTSILDVLTRRARVSDWLLHDNLIARTVRGFGSKPTYRRNLERVWGWVDRTVEETGSKNTEDIFISKAMTYIGEGLTVGDRDGVLDAIQHLSYSYGASRTRGIPDYLVTYLKNMSPEDMAKYGVDEDFVARVEDMQRNSVRQANNVREYLERQQDYTVGFRYWQDTLSEVQDPNPTEIGAIPYALRQGAKTLLYPVWKPVEKGRQYAAVTPKYLKPVAAPIGFAGAAAPLALLMNGVLYDNEEGQYNIPDTVLEATGEVARTFGQATFYGAPGIISVLSDDDDTEPAAEEEEAEAEPDTPDEADTPDEEDDAAARAEEERRAREAEEARRTAEAEVTRLERIAATTRGLADANPGDAALAAEAAEAERAAAAARAALESPDRPDEPDRPDDDPDRPDRPDDDPDRPDRPDRPDDDPDRPDRPDRPDEPDRPDAPDRRPTTRGPGSDYGVGALAGDAVRSFSDAMSVHSEDPDPVTDWFNRTTTALWNSGRDAVGFIGSTFNKMAGNKEGQAMLGIGGGVLSGFVTAALGMKLLRSKKLLGIGNWPIVGTVLSIGLFVVGFMGGRKALHSFAFQSGDESSHAPSSVVASADPATTRGTGHGGGLPTPDRILLGTDRRDAHIMHEIHAVRDASTNQWALQMATDNGQSFVATALLTDKAFTDLRTEGRLIGQAYSPPSLFDDLEHDLSHLEMDAVTHTKPGQDSFVFTVDGKHYLFQVDPDTAPQLGIE